ncbi:MAG: c-type cytochrome [Calditrichaeota bacterium]|nr:c-type cytochrome [Calditrichota bacterium]
MLRLFIIFFILCGFSCKPKRPTVYPSDTITYGEAFFLNNCAECHGDRGESADLDKYPRIREQNYSFDEIKEQMQYPTGTVMPAFEDVPDSIIVQITYYINNE